MTPRNLCTRTYRTANTFAEGTYYVKFDLGLHLKKQISFIMGMLTFTLQNVSGIGRRYPSGWTNVIPPPIGDGSQSILGSLRSLTA